MTQQNTRIGLANVRSQQSFASHFSHARLATSVVGVEHIPSLRIVHFVLSCHYFMVWVPFLVDWRQVGWSRARISPDSMVLGWSSGILLIHLLLSLYVCVEWVLSGSNWSIVLYWTAIRIQSWNPGPLRRVGDNLDWLELLVVGVTH